MLGDFEVLPKEIITQAFQSTENGLTGSLSSRVENTIDKLCRYIENNQDSIIERYTKYSYELFKTAKTDDDKNKMRTMFAKDRTEISKY